MVIIACIIGLILGLGLGVIITQTKSSCNHEWELIEKGAQEEINPKQDLYYEFKCTDADEDGIFYDTCFGEIDTTEFSQIIDDMENYEISKEKFKDKFTLTKSINKIINNPESEEWLEFYDKSDEDGYVVIFDGDIHYIYSV